MLVDYNKSEYEERIWRADSIGLVVISYELMIRAVDDGKKAIESGEYDSAEKELSRARGFLNELASSLDMRHDLSRSLMNLYVYTNGLMIRAETCRRTEPLDEAGRILGALHMGFAKAEKAAPLPSELFYSVNYDGRCLEPEATCWSEYRV